MLCDNQGDFMAHMTPGGGTLQHRQDNRKVSHDHCPLLKQEGNSRTRQNPRHAFLPVGNSVLPRQIFIPSLGNWSMPAFALGGILLAYLMENGAGVKSRSSARCRVSGVRARCWVRERFQPKPILAAHQHADRGLKRGADS